MLHREAYPKKEEEDVYPQEPHFLAGPLNICERNVHEALRILHEIIALLSNSCWRVASMEEPSSIKDLEAIQEAMTSIKGNFL